MPPEAPIAYAAGSIIETQMIGELNGEPVMNVLAWKVKQAVLPAAGVVQLVQDVATLFGSNISNRMRYIGCRQRLLRPNGPTEYRTDEFAPIPGGASGECMPNQVSQVMVIKCLGEGKPDYGLVYLPGMPFSHWSNNAYSLLANSVHNGLRGQLMQFLSETGSDPRVQLGVASRKFGPYDFAVMTSIEWSSYPGVRRSRRPAVIL